MTSCAWCSAPATGRVKVGPHRYADVCPDHAARFGPASQPDGKPQTPRKPTTGPTCPLCGAEVLWASTGSKNLRIERYRLKTTEPKPGMVVFNPRTGNGRTVKKVNVEEAKRWLRAGAELHLLHAANRECQEIRRMQKLAEEHVAA